RRHTRSKRDWSSDVCSSDLRFALGGRANVHVSSGTILTGGTELEWQRQRGTTLDTARHTGAVYAQAVAGLERAVSMTVGARLERSEERRVGKEGRSGGRAAR